MVTVCMGLDVRDAAQWGGALPDWARLAEVTNQVRIQFPDLYTIAWGWVLTPMASILPEDNSDWGAVTPQRLHDACLAGRLRTEHRRRGGYFALETIGGGMMQKPRAL